MRAEPRRRRRRLRGRTRTKATDGSGSDDRDDGSDGGVDGYTVVNNTRRRQRYRRFRPPSTRATIRGRRRRRDLADEHERSVQDTAFARCLLGGRTSAEVVDSWSLDGYGCGCARARASARERSRSFGVSVPLSLSLSLSLSLVRSLCVSLSLSLFFPRTTLALTRARTSLASFLSWRFYLFRSPFLSFSRARSPACPSVT